MGEYADLQIEAFFAGRMGSHIPKPREFPQTSRHAIANERFKIVEVTNTAQTNRLRGTKLIVCDQDDTYYWVWASQKVTGIAKAACSTLKDDLTLNDALAALGRKPYVPAYSIEESRPPSLVERARNYGTAANKPRGPGF